MNPSLLWSIAILLAVLYAAIVEYSAHRWVMHIPGLGRGEWWREHAIEHHGHGRNDVNIFLSAATVALAASPLLGFCALLGWPWVAFLLSAAILYAATWSSLHAAYHGVSGCWVERFAIFAHWKRHHLAHHAHPSKNFGTIFIFTDRLFRTRCQHRNSSAQ